MFLAPTVEYTYVGHVQDDFLLSCDDQALQFLTEKLLSRQHYTTVQFHYGHSSTSLFVIFTDMLVPPTPGKRAAGRLLV